MSPAASRRRSSPQRAQPGDAARAHRSALERHPGSTASAGRLRRPAQRALLDHEHAGERNRDAQRAAANTQRKPSDAARCRPSAALGDNPRIAGAPASTIAPNPVTMKVRAERAKEIHGAGRDAELVQRNRVLHHHDGEREHRTQPEPGERDQAERDRGRQRRRAQPRAGRAPRSRPPCRAIGTRL